MQRIDWTMKKCFFTGNSIDGDLPFLVIISKKKELID
jgi:hypothetical protein